MSVRTRAHTGTTRRPVAQRTSRVPQASHLVHSPAAIDSASRRPHAATDTLTATTRATIRTARFRLSLPTLVYCSSFKSLACSSVATLMRWPTTIQLSPCTVWFAFNIHILCLANYRYFMRCIGSGQLFSAAQLVVEVLFVIQVIWFQTYR